MIDKVSECICETQARIYELAADTGYDMKAFSDAYLASSFCERAMDTVYSRFQFADAEECFDFLIPEIGERVPKGSGYFDPAVAHWIGYTYRQMAFELQMGSRELSKRLSFELMCQYYPGLHTIDEEMSAEIIMSRM